MIEQEIQRRQLSYLD